ncbi:MAG TPA: hypothetical protein VH593_16695 [Ktedonobacteraceae bacterium]
MELDFGIDPTVDTAFAIRIRLEAFQNVINERIYQDLKYGGYDHDIVHTPNDWIAFITQQAGLAVDVPEEDFLEQMLHVAALAVAAYETLRLRQINEASDG